MLKYPRTPHLEGSRLQPGDEDLAAVPLAELRGRPLVIEEKLDGANAALSFGPEGLRLQSRGHYLRGGRGERPFDLLKTWAAALAPSLRPVLGERYVVYGEWLGAKHTIYYDLLPHYFLEFDVFDRERACFLSTPARRALLGELLAAVPVLASGPAPADVEALRDLVRPSLYKTPAWTDRLREDAAARGQDPERLARETDPSDLAEGLYLKWEEEGEVRGRYKWIRKSFLTAVLDSGSHWVDRPVFPNRLAPGVELFA